MVLRIVRVISFHQIHNEIQFLLIFPYWDEYPSNAKSGGIDLGRYKIISSRGVYGTAIAQSGIDRSSIL